MQLYSDKGLLNDYQKSSNHLKKAYYMYRPHPYFGGFYPGKILSLIEDVDTFSKYFSESYRIKLAIKYFPNGLSPHGLSVLLNYQEYDIAFSEPITEIIFELVWQLHFPNALSRMACLYASESIESARPWKELFLHNSDDPSGVSTESLWEIAYKGTAQSYDARYLSIMSQGNFSYLTALDYAYKYWQGSRSENPLPELLVPYPVTIVQCVDSFL